MRRTHSRKVLARALDEMGEATGYDLMAATDSHSGTVYPILSAWRDCGYIRSRSEVVDGRHLRVCRLTKKGRRALAWALEG